MGIVRSICGEASCQRGLQILSFFASVTVRLRAGFSQIMKDLLDFSIFLLQRLSYLKGHTQKSECCDVWIGSLSDTERISFARIIKVVIDPHIASVAAMASFWASLLMMSGMLIEVQSAPTA